MATFQNTRTGRVVDVPDEAPTHRDYPGRGKQWSRLALRMDESKRWKRVTADTQTAAQRPPAKKTAAKKTTVAKQEPETQAQESQQLDES